MKKQFLTMAVLAALLTGSAAVVYADTMNPGEGSQLTMAADDSRHGDN
jgi:hypothetical protein